MKTLLAMILFLPLSAQAGDKVLNGCDACERRFLEVRADIDSWIRSGGHQALRLPTGTTAEQYSERMLHAMGSAKVTCTDDRLALGDVEKTCLNSIDEQGNARIQCQSDRYLRLSQDEQYRLTHHEYAGLAGFEANASEESRYELSDQITAYLDTLNTKKLSVKTAGTMDELIQRNWGNFFGIYEVLGCSATANISLEPNQPDFCKIKKLALRQVPSAKDAPAVAVDFLETDGQLPGIGIYVAWAECQLGYGASFCKLGAREDSKNNVTSRIEQFGDTYLFDVATENGMNSFRKSSLVLKRVN